MFRNLTSLVIFVSILLGHSSMMAKPPGKYTNPGKLIESGPTHLAKSVADTVLIFGPHGSGALFNGQFETPSGESDWQGWTSEDLTAAPWTNHWNASTYHAENLNGNGAGNLALWCGEMTFSACSGADEDGGYGNNYDDAVLWVGTVADPGQPCQVTIDAWLNYDLEAGYDFLHLNARMSDDTQVSIAQLDGQATNLHLQETVTYQPGDYVGPDSDQVHLEFRVISDPAYSDEDCQYPTIGACQIDDIQVSLDNGSVTSFSDFEDGTLGDWEQDMYRPQVGDYAKIWSGLEDYDPCQTNYSPQMAFIDDGVVFPGTEGTWCINWCYGPGGYIVNNSGGLIGPETGHLNNVAISPVIDLAALDPSIFQLEFDLYAHFNPLDEDAGMFETWKVRSTESDDAADLLNSPWEQQPFAYYRTGYFRESNFLDDYNLVSENARFMQIALGVRETGYSHGFDGDNGTPAPYFDNVRLSAIQNAGPRIFTYESSLAQDAFPESGQIDWDNPAANNVRFDRVKTLSGIPYDTIAINVKVNRPGASLTGPPAMHYRLIPNSLFDPYRTSGLPNQGSVESTSSSFSFDLPDSGFLFPGDVLRYYFTASNELDGEIKSSILPADTTGYSMDADDPAYDRRFTVRALPNTTGSEEYMGPAASVLFWNHGGTEGRQHWLDALADNGLQLGYNCDEYFTNAAEELLGSENHLGERATLQQLESYSTILISTGSTWNNVLKSEDWDLLSQWLPTGGKNLLVMGDDVAYSTAGQVPGGESYLADILGIEFQEKDIRPIINNQMSPTLVMEQGNPVFSSYLSLFVNGSCPSINTQDAVVALPHAEKLAGFGDPSGNPSYQYSAATLCTQYGTVVSAPISFMDITTAPGKDGSFSPDQGRNQFLGDILEFFRVHVSGVPVPLTVLTADNFPNPFNPSTTIEYSLPRDGHLAIKIFDVRGNLVTTLVDEPRPMGPGHVVWEGKNEEGRAVSSGVYFYEVRAARDVLVQKMTLVK